MGAPQFGPQGRYGVIAVSLRYVAHQGETLVVRAPFASQGVLDVLLVDIPVAQLAAQGLVGEGSQRAALVDPLVGEGGIVHEPGTIDAGYRGEVGVILVNLGAEPFTVEKGMKVAQVVVASVVRAEVVEVAEPDTTERGADGFGSTGV